jgi:hypothetical protein
MGDSYAKCTIENASQQHSRIGTQIKSEAGNNLPLVTRLKVILVARPLLMPVAKKLCSFERSTFMTRTCVQCQILLLIEIVFCCS